MDLKPGVFQLIPCVFFLLTEGFPGHKSVSDILLLLVSQQARQFQRVRSMKRSSIIIPALKVIEFLLRPTIWMTRSLP